MRTFYIFNIKEEYASLTKNNPYHLFKMLSYIYHMDTSELESGVEMFKKITNNFDSKKLDINLFRKYRKNYFYTKFKNVHQINNYYQKEESKLVIRKRFLLLKSTVIRPSFMADLAEYKNVFFCDFENKDYFFLEMIES
jgi:hypothetical protein